MNCVQQTLPCTGLSESMTAEQAVPTPVVVLDDQLLVVVGGGTGTLILS